MGVLLLHEAEEVEPAAPTRTTSKRFTVARAQVGTVLHLLFCVCQE